MNPNRESPDATAVLLAEVPFARRPWKMELMPKESARMTPLTPSACDRCRTAAVGVPATGTGSAVFRFTITLRLA